MTEMAQEYITQEEFEAALSKLEPIAMQVLERQLMSEDERIAQNAAKLLIELRRGKPKQQINNTNDTVHTIRYEAAAWRPDKHHDEHPVVDAAAVVGLLEEGD